MNLIKNKMKATKNYIEFEQKSYKGDEYVRWVKSKTEDDIDSMLPREDENSEPPVPIITKWRCYCPEEIVDVSETFSMEESQYNAEDIRLDMIEMIYKSGEARPAIGSLKEFDKVFEEWKALNKK